MATFAAITGTVGEQPAVPALPGASPSGESFVQRYKWQLVGGGVVAVGLVAFLARKQVGAAVSSVEAAAVRALMPKGTEYLADLAFELGPKYDVSPYTILGITFAESDFGRQLTPKGPGGTGDFIPRPVSKDPAVNARRASLPGVTRQTLANGIPRRGIEGPVEAWVPGARGWGHGLYQLDWEAFNSYLAGSNDWADPRKAMEKALALYAGNKAKIKAAVPNLGPVDLLRATVASYNAGVGAVIPALRAGVPADQLDKGAARSKGGTRVTFGQGYVDHILGKASSFTKAGKAA